MSNDQESAPFAILDGTEPTGSIVVEGLVNNKWNLGETKTISWDIVSKNPLASVSDLKIQYGNSSNTILQNIPVGTLSGSYTLPYSSAFV